MTGCKTFLGVISSGMNLNKELKKLFFENWLERQPFFKTCIYEGKVLTDIWKSYASLGFVLFEQGEISESTVLVELVGELFIMGTEPAKNFCRMSSHLGLYICTSRFCTSCNLGQE
jgi:hypothetical protein